MVQVVNDQMDIYDIKYVQQEMNLKQHQTMYRSIHLIDRFVDSLLHIQISHMICPIFSEKTNIWQLSLRIPDIT